MEQSSINLTCDTDAVSPEISQTLWVTARTMFPKFMREGLLVPWLYANVFQWRSRRWDIGLYSTSIPSYDSTLIYEISRKQTVNIQHRNIHYYNAKFIHLFVCNKIITQSLNTSVMHLTKLLKIHTYTQHVTWKPIREKTTRFSSSWIGMRK